MDNKHVVRFSDMLKNKTVKAVRRLEKSEMEALMWYKNPLVLVFQDNTQLILQCDDEGNDGGAAIFYDGEQGTMETIYTV
jgi:hypothetical protein